MDELEVDELDKGNISAAAGKQGWAELFQTRTNIKLYQITLNYKIFCNTNVCSPNKRKGFTIAPFPQKKNMRKDPPRQYLLFCSHCPSEHIFQVGAYASFSPCYI